MELMWVVFIGGAFNMKIHPCVVLMRINQRRKKTIVILSKPKENGGLWVVDFFSGYRDYLCFLYILTPFQIVSLHSNPDAYDTTNISTTTTTTIAISTTTTATKAVLCCAETTEGGYTREEAINWTSSRGTTTVC